MEPIQFMLENQEIIRKVYLENGGGVKTSWSKLIEALPEIGKVMSYNTYKQYIRAFATIMDKVSKPVTQELHKNIDGWTVHKGRDGYYRLHKHVKGKGFSIYGGKNLDLDKIRTKIQEKEKSLTFNPFYGIEFAKEN